VPLDLAFRGPHGGCHRNGYHRGAVSPGAA
jgi:hypothetical protein